MSNAHPPISTTKTAFELYNPVSYAVAEIVNREFMSLLSLAEDLDDDEMADIICHLSEAASSMFPNARRMFESARALADRLDAVTFEAIAQREMAGTVIDNLDAAIRYHGARIADVTTRLAQVI
ncbi:MAG: hypothetical protein KDK53_06180 [Maritimibacter sp.]|nr:hypothetical protein [Maritimibacter sp.]